MEAPEIDKLPASIQTEVTILGAMLLDAVAITDATAKLRPEDFALDSHQRIYRVMVEMLGANQPIDLITVMNGLGKKGELDAVGGSGYLAYLTEGIPRNPNIESYVTIVKDKSVLRQLFNVCNEGMIAASDASENSANVLASIETQLAEVAQRSISGGFVTVGEIMQAVSSVDEFLSGGSTQGTIATGYALDRWTNCFKPDELIILAARPSMGKTAIALNFAANSALRYRKQVGILTLEMSKEALLRRMVQAEARIPKRRFVAGLSSDEKRRAMVALESLMDAGLHIDDKPFTTMQEIRAKARRLKQSDNLDLLIIDYLGLIEPPAKSENRTQEVSAMSRGLKGLAKELGIPVIALAQLNRKCEERSDKRPMLSDLRDSGSIEQDADDVLFIYREEVYMPEDTAVRGKAELIVAKQRDGRVGRLKMVYAGEITRFEDEAYSSEQDNYHV